MYACYFFIRIDVCLLFLYSYRCMLVISFSRTDVCLLFLLVVLMYACYFFYSY